MQEFLKHLQPLLQVVTKSKLGEAREEMMLELLAVMAFTTTGELVNQTTLEGKILRS